MARPAAAPTDASPPEGRRVTYEGGRVTIELTAEEREALAASRAQFSPKDLAEIELRQREGQKVIARLAATETLEQQQRLADELCPRFDDWIHGRNRIQSTPARAPRVVAIITPRARNRERRPAATR